MYTISVNLKFDEFSQILTEWAIYLYRVTLVVAYLSWVDFDFCHSSVCLVLLGQIEIWLSQLGSWAYWWCI